MRKQLGKGPVGVGLLAAVLLIGWALANPGPSRSESVSEILDDAINDFPLDASKLPIADGTIDLDSLDLKDLEGLISKEQLEQIVREQLKLLAEEYIDSYEPPAAAAGLPSRSPTYAELFDGSTLQQMLDAVGGQSSSGSGSDASLEDLYRTYLAITGQSGDGSGSAGPLSGLPGRSSAGGAGGPSGSAMLGSKANLGDEYTKLEEDLADAFGDLTKKLN